MLVIERSINALNEKVGILTSYLALPLIVVVVWEVVMRYAFNSPTSWGFETTTFIYGVHFVLGFGFTHLHDGHVSIDVFEAKLPRKPRAILRLLTNGIIFLPTIGLITAWSVIYAVDSWQNWEKASTSWAPPLYPFKTLMALGFVLLFLQGVSKMIGDIRALSGPEQ